MVRAGWHVVRFVWDDVYRDPSYVHAVLSDLVADGDAGTGQTA